MSAHCCPPAPAASNVSPAYRGVLWVALAANALMFAIEAGAGAVAGSAALLADAADFFGDALNYGASLTALAAGGLWVSRVALAKGWVMGVYGIGVLVLTGWNAWRGVLPEPVTMGAVGVLALAVNLGVAVLLFRYRDGDANMRSVWLCTRNDAIGNLAVLMAALGVFGSGAAWPDWIVAVLMAGLALQASASVIRAARRELAAPEPLRQASSSA
jgi:Co/Zn/Cd efflux system component